MSFDFEVWDWVYLAFVFAGLYGVWVLSSKFAKNEENEVPSSLEGSEEGIENEYQ